MPNKFFVDVVHARTEALDGRPIWNVSGSARCGICKKSFLPKHAVMRVDGFPGGFHVEFHRTCMESLLASSVEDLPVEKSKFEHYRLHVANKLGLAVG